MTNIILCGGNGTRLWPVSRTSIPKQFVKFFQIKNLNQESLFQSTVKRNSKICNYQYIISSYEQYFLAFDQLEEIDKQRNKYLLEPCGRNTAPAITLACLTLDSEEIVLVTPSDHIIKDEVEYKKLLHTAKNLAKQNYLVTFGIKPSCAETEFGYIEVNGDDVKKFHEKPDTKTAQNYFADENFYWNSGIFCFKVSVLLNEIKKYSPQIYEQSKNAINSSYNTQVDITRIKHNDMINIPEDSIDYAVMEKSDKLKMIVSDIGWSDLGTFDALYTACPKDKNGNTLNTNYISIDSKNNFIYGSKRKIATVDIEDLIIVDTNDALLISQKKSSNKLKQIVTKLKKDSVISKAHTTVDRPWGTYTVLEDIQGYKIKRLEVKPKKRLSLQKHHHRNEHWIVVSGTAKVTVENEVKILNANESTYIKMGEIHRLENKGSVPLVLIEVQVGDYLGEDDIVRLDDDYKRK